MQISIPKSSARLWPLTSVLRNLNLVYEIQFWCTESRFGTPMNFLIGVPNFVFVYQICILVYQRTPKVSAGELGTVELNSSCEKLHR